MSYSEQQALSVDADFTNRLWAALSVEAQTRPAGDPVAGAVLANPFVGVGMFMPFIATAPGFDGKYAAGGQSAITDGDILSAVQASWPMVPAPA